MPNRLIKESICASEDLNKLSPMAENLFYRLMVNVDDYGAYYGNPSIVKSNCFPLKSDDIKSDQVDSWLNELEKAGLIFRYTANGRQYVQFVKWEKHQQIRAKKRKFPAHDSTCNQMISDDSKCPRNPIQSNPNTKQSETKQCECEDDEDDGFDAFWEAYPSKAGDIRQAYFEYLGVLKQGVAPETLLEAVKWQSEVKEARYMGSAEKWLRNKGWTEKRQEAPVSRNAPAACKDYGPVTMDDYDFGDKI